MSTSRNCCNSTFRLSAPYLDYTVHSHSQVLVTARQAPYASLAPPCNTGNLRLSATAFTLSCWYGWCLVMWHLFSAATTVIEAPAGLPVASINAAA
jgi:hypothetical protein